MARRRARSKGVFRFMIETDPGWDKLALAFKGAEKDFEDWRAPLREVATKVIIPGHRKHIKTRGRSVGFPWPRLNKDYQRRKRREGFGSKTLHRTGKLVGDITKIIRLTKSSVSVGTKVPYGRAVHFGVIQGNIAPRRIVGWGGTSTNKSNPMIKGAEKILQKHVDSLLEKIVKRFGKAREI